MKRKLLLSLGILIASCSFLSAQTYHEDDKEGLREIIRKHNLVMQPGRIDTTNWQVSEQWVETFPSYIEWSTDSPKRVKKLKWNGYYPEFGAVLGDVNLEKFQALTHFNCDQHEMTSLDVSKNIALEELICSRAIHYEYDDYPSITSLDVSNNINLRVLDCNSTRIEGLDVSKNLKLAVLKCGSTGIENLDVSKNLNLAILKCDGTKIESLDVSKNLDLISLSCSYTNIEIFDVSKNLELDTLFCGGPNLKNLDLSKNRKLRALSLQWSEIKNLDLSNNGELEYLSYSGTKQLKVDLTVLPRLKQLMVYDSGLTDIDVSQNQELVYLDCSSNSFLYSKMPLTVPNVNSSSQNVSGGLVVENSIIDLSSEYNIDGYITSYKWLDENRRPVNLVSLGNGKFVANPAYLGQKIHCEMYNDRFRWTLVTYTITIVKEAITLEDHLKLNVNNIHSFEPSQQIQIYLRSTSDNPDNISFGLYNATSGAFRYALKTISRKNFAYKCQIPANAVDGSYFIAPFVVEDGQRVMIERGVASPFIDKLPAKIESDIWGRSLAISDDVNASKSMQLNISNKVNEIFEVEQFKSFKVSMPTSDPLATSIGLFFLDGEFYEDITTGRNPNNASTYSCVISDLVAGGNYMLMPYIMDNGEVKVVERGAGTKLMDRLPINVIEDDIWGYSISSKSAKDAQISEVPMNSYISDNHVYVKGLTTSAMFTLYSLSGAVVKSTNVKAYDGLSLQNIATGTYILNVVAEDGTVDRFTIMKD